MKENKNKIKKDLFNGVICKEGNRQTAGITLIALIITIIILIILAGVTLNMLHGENGIINRTKTAREENERATATETMNLKITNVQISKYAEEQRMPTLKELADNFCEDNDFEKVIEKTEVGSLTKISNENPTAIITKLKAYPYEFEINSSLQLASIDGVKVATLPTNDEDTIVSMTKSELQELINASINNSLKDYSRTNEVRSGTINFGILSSLGYASKTITFSEPLDSASYSVVVTCTGGGANWASVQYVITQKDANGFSVGAFNNAGAATGTSVTVNYIAIPYK